MMMLIGLLVMLYASMVKSESVSQRLSSVDQKDVIIVQQIIQNLMYNIDELSRSNSICTDEFKTFVEDNTITDVNFISTGDPPFQFNRVGAEQFYGFFCDIAIPTFKDEDHFDSSFAVLSYTKTSDQEIITAASKTYIYSNLINVENNPRATFVLRNRWEFTKDLSSYKKRRGGNNDNKDREWLISKWEVEPEQIDINNLI